MENKGAQEVLEFWFGKLENKADFPQEKASMWFGNGANYDAEIKQKFSLLHQQACNNQLQHWQSSSDSLLALIIILDQFSRHIYRNTARSFAQDKQAIKLVQYGIDQGLDQSLFYVQRKFFYMPLMHAEDLEIQKLSIEMFTRLRDEVPSELTETYARSLSFAESHYYVISKFGRFPELNEILDRESTQDELDFLATGKYRFS